MAKCSRVQVSIESHSPLLIFADDWGRHPSSCQHLARRLRHDFRIVWANSVGTRRAGLNAFTIRRGLEKLGSWAKGLQPAGQDMWVVDLPMVPAAGGYIANTINPYLVEARLSKVLDRVSAEAPIVLTTLPHVGRLTSRLRRKALVYYCTDDYRYWPGANGAALERAETQLCRDADLIVAASRSLADRLSAIRPCHYLPHGVDYAHFAQTQNVAAIPAELAQIPGPRIGFFGLIYEKIDFELLAAVAHALPNASLVMVGPVAYCPPAFRSLSNVHFVGKKAYAELPQWLAGFEVLLMPYLDDPMIRQSNPLKLRECLATGKPTVSVDVPEARSLQPHLKIASDRQEFLAHVRDALEAAPDLHRVSLQQAAVRADDWSQRADQLARLLKPLDVASCATF